MDARETQRCIDQFGTDVYRFCLKLCAIRADAEDLYQQTFLKSMESDWELDWGQNPKALFFSLTYHLWKSDRRKAARRASIAPSVSMEEDGLGQLHSGESVEAGVLQKDLLTAVSRLIEELPEKYRVPMTLYYLFELPVEQIARTIDKPPGTVKSRLFKGRSLLKTRLEDAGYGE